MEENKEWSKYNYETKAILCGQSPEQWSTKEIVPPIVTSVWRT